MCCPRAQLERSRPRNSNTLNLLKTFPKVFSDLRSLFGDVSVVVGAVDVVADEPAGSGADEDVARKVLLGHNARCTDSGGRGVYDHLLPSAVVLAGDDGG